MQMKERATRIDPSVMPSVHNQQKLNKLAISKGAKETPEDLNLIFAYGQIDNKIKWHIPTMRVGKCNKTYYKHKKKTHLNFGLTQLL